MENQSKEFWKSKTFWAAVVCAVAGQVPPVAAWAAANPEACTAFVGLLFGGLRVATKNPIALSVKKSL